MSLILDALRIKKNSSADATGSGLMVNKEPWYKSFGTRKGQTLILSIIFLSVALVLGLEFYRDHQAGEAIVSEASELAPVPLAVAPVAPKPTNIEKTLEAYTLGNYQENSQLLREALAEEGKSQALLNLAGLNSLKLGSYDEAEQYFSKALAVNNVCAECYNNLGYLLTLKSDPKNAEENLKKSIAINSDYADPYFNLAVLYQKYGDEGQAKIFFEHYLKKAPNQNNQLAMDMKTYLDELGN